nr:hypothetical protein Iba_scaffold13909CG0030 [Ipomoea batatas]
MEGTFLKGLEIIDLTGHSMLLNLSQETTTRSVLEFTQWIINQNSLFWLIVPLVEPAYRMGK